MNRFPAPVSARPRFAEYPFSLGVASGDPLSDGVVLWTRLAPDPLNGGGMGQESVPVQWIVAHDEAMTQVVQQGTTLALPELAHSVHVEVSGLQPARWYWYRFEAGNEVSPVGRTRTAPAVGDPVAELRFAFVSCQNYEQGLFTAYRHLAGEDLDLIVHLGDYIYEGAMQAGRVRSHGTPMPTTLQGYRDRYALYKTDRDLQATHAAFPWVVTWDDHEVENNYAGTVDIRNSPASVFLPRRAAAYQAYWEHLPLRAASMPVGPDARLYRRLAFGDLVELSVLDTRQYRTDQPCDDGIKPRCLEALSPGATMTGPEQERWLLDGLDASAARWNIIAQQAMMAQLDRQSGVIQTFNLDQWDGYPAARERITSFLERRQPSNPVILSGDIHANWVADIKSSFDDPSSPTVATELIGTSISSGGNGFDPRPGSVYITENPHIKFWNSQRGYVLCSVTPERLEANFRVVPYVDRPGAPVSTRARFVITDGRPGADLVS